MSSLNDNASPHSPVMDSNDDSSVSSKASSHHSSEGQDDFKEDTSQLETAKTYMRDRFRSKSVSLVPYLGQKTPKDSEPPKAKTHRPIFGRSVSVTEEPKTQLQPETEAHPPRLRSKSCIGELSSPIRKPRMRKISTNSLGSFGRGFEGLLLSKPEVLISPDISREHSPEVSRKKEAENAEEDGEQEDVVITAPKRIQEPYRDHGYAWVIVFGAGLSFFLGGGFGRCFPLIYQRLMVRFQSSATATAWVAAMHGAVKLCSSPIVSALCNRFGIRAVVMSGGLLTASGLLLSAFPPSLSWIYLTYSTISAVGSNMVHAPGFIMVGQYFDKKKGTAMAIATTCLTLGGVAFAPLIEVFFTEYGYSGAMLLVSGIMLHYCVTGSLYRPPPGHQKSTANQKLPDKTRDLKSANQEKGHKLGKLDATNQKSSLNPSDSTNPRSKSVIICIDDTDNSSGRPKSCGHKLRRGILNGLKLLGVHLGLPLLCDSACLGYGLLMGATFWAFGITNTFVVGLAIEVADIPPKDMAVMLSVTSATDIACRLLSGVLFDAKKLKQHRVGMLLWIAALAGVTTALLPFATTYVTFFLVLAVCSGMKSALHTQHVTVLAQLVGPKKLSSAMGLMRFFQGVGVMVGLATGGLLTDLFGTYSHAFTVGGAILVMATAIFTSRHFCCAHDAPQATPTSPKNTPTSTKDTPTSTKDTPTSAKDTPTSTKDTTSLSK